MDGRLALNIKLSEFEQSTGLKVSSSDVDNYFNEPKFNISSPGPLLVTSNSKPSDPALFKWGLIPGWSTSKNSKSLLSISLGSFVNKPAFQQALTSKRCLIWCTGFYLWKNTPGGKIPFHIFSTSDKAMALAGLWETWDDNINTCCLITRDSKNSLPFFQSEVPVVLNVKNREQWLQPLSDPLKLIESETSLQIDLDYFPVNRKIIKSTDNDPRFLNKVPYLVAEQTSMFGF